MAWVVARLVTASTEELAIRWTDLAPVLTDGADDDASKDPAKIKQLMDPSALISALVMLTTLTCKFLILFYDFMKESFLVFF